MHTLIDIIKDYQEAADAVVTIFKNKYKVNNLLEGYHSKVYDQTGKISEEGLHFYAFHGIGLTAHFNDTTVDFDFAFFPEPRHDGFDLWRLGNFINDQKNKYPEYKDKKKIEAEFNNLIAQGVIAKPKLEFSTTLYFFKETLGNEISEGTEKTVDLKENLTKPRRSWWRKFFAINLLITASIVAYTQTQKISSADFSHYKDCQQYDNWKTDKATH